MSNGKDRGNEEMSGETEGGGHCHAMNLCISFLVLETALAYVYKRQVNILHITCCLNNCVYGLHSKNAEYP